jgi:hypothetical protein
MVSLGTDANAFLGRFVDKQRRDEQFSEDMKKVMYGGGTQSGSGRAPAGTSAGRTRSPGLAAGAALALGGLQSAAEAHSEARAQCRQAVEYARRQACPFDDHAAFGASPADRTAPVRAPLLEQQEVNAAVRDARNTGKYNRDIQQKVGAGAPFDAPETSFGSSAGSLKSRTSGRFAAPPAIPQMSVAETALGARTEAAANKTRMRGCEDLLGGYLPDKAPQQQARRNNSLPPRPERDTLLPEAMFKLQYDGGCLRDLNTDKSAYLNSKVSMEANRERNRAGVVLG